MSLYLRARMLKQNVRDELFRSLKAASERNLEEFKAAITIQRFIRGCFARGRVHNMHRAATKIQKVYRGYKDRKVVTVRIRDSVEQNRLSFFNKMATLIQKIFRGFFSRKYCHDYYARKRYIDSVIKKNEKVKSMLEQEAKDIEIQENMRMQEQTEKAVREMVLGMHHMISTKITPGVFNSPYQRDDPPSILGLPMEEHLRMAGKEKAAQQVKDDEERSKLPRIKTTSDQRAKKTSRISVQASSPYSIVEAARSEERKIDTSMRVDKQDFITAVKRDSKAPFIGSINDGVPYGTRATFREVDLSKSISKKPFCSATGRSTTFEDVMTEES